MESAIREFEKKAENEPILGHLIEDATKLFNIVKQNVDVVHQYPLRCDLFSFNNVSNELFKIRLYDGKTITVSLNVFAEDMQQIGEFHTHSKHTLLHNFCGEYKHIIWRIIPSKTGKLYKFPYKRYDVDEGNTLDEIVDHEFNFDEINGELEYVDISNYKPGNWRYLNLKQFIQ